MNSVLIEVKLTW